jgi:hypothetical protein
MQARLSFRIAESEAEFEAIHRLNYRTFVEEIPQHGSNPEQRLVDRFHAQNTYIIALAGSELAGMLALRTERPFSLHEKLPELDDYLPIGGQIAEVRLLAIEPHWRGSAVMAGLANFLEPECRARKLEMLIVSATTRQRRLYRHLGFSEFGPLVGHEGAWFQPMRLTWPQFQQIVPSATWRRRDG